MLIRFKGIDLGTFGLPPRDKRIAAIAVCWGGFRGPSDAERTTLGATARCRRFVGRVVRAKTAVFLGITLVQHRLGHRVSRALLWTDVRPLLAWKRH